MSSYEQKKQLKVEQMDFYFNWMLTPPVERVPATKTELAAGMGISTQTLYNYEKDPDFRRRISSAKEQLSAAWYGDIMGRLKTVVDTGAESNAINAAKVLLQHLGIPQEPSQRIHGLDIEALKEAIEILEREG